MSLSSSSRGGRRRSPIWEHFLLGKNADGNRVAQCTFCSRVMKSQPDRMENHFLKLCGQVDEDTRSRWLHERDTMSSADAALQSDRIKERDATLGTFGFGFGGTDAAGAGSLQEQVAAAAAAGDAHVQQLKSAAVADEDHEIHDPELSTALPAPTKPTRSRRARVGSSNPIIKQQPLEQLQQPGSHFQPESQYHERKPQFSILKDVNGKTERVELENVRLTTRGERDLLDGQALELKRRKLEIEERKALLQMESMRYDNDIKRIKVAEENMLARMRLRDAGVPQTEIDLMLPLQKPEVV